MSEPRLFIGSKGDAKANDARGRPIAVIRGGTRDGDIIYLCGDIPINPKDKLAQGEKIELMDAIKRKFPADDDAKVKRRLSHLIKTAGTVALKTALLPAGTREITITDGELEPLPNPRGRECVYVAGASGSGKSFYTEKYARNYHAEYPNNKIILISKVADDISLKGVPALAIEANRDLVDDPIEARELANTLVIFDDTDTIKDKQTRDAINQLKGDILETGRHHKTSIAITSHLITNYGETRTVLNESHAITVYPKSGSTYHISRLLNVYFGMSKQQQERVLGLNSRWITLTRHYPQMVIYEKGCYLL